MIFYVLKKNKRDKDFSKIYLVSHLWISYFYFRAWNEKQTDCDE